MNSDQKFFFDHAGYSFDPRTETQQQGRERCALALAAAESLGRAAGVSFNWEVDQSSDSSDWNSEEPAYAQWVCVAYDASGNHVACLGGVDFGRGGSPHGSDYRRVVEAELAQEYLSTVVNEA